jgi:serine/threonine protein kinase
MIMDLLPCGELLGVIEKHREEKAAMGRGQEACGVELCRFYLGEVVLALEYLHAEGIVHRGATLR